MSSDLQSGLIVDSSPKLVRSPPETIEKNKQFDLFTQFFGNPKELSNTIELWDAVPKYAISQKQQSRMRDSNHRLPVLEHDFEYRATTPSLQKKDYKCTLKLQPASIKTEQGYMDFYPSPNEELVEEVLRKMFCDQKYGLHDIIHNESWVRFTIHRIREELKAHRKTRSYDEVMQSLEILAHCVLDITIHNNGDSLVYTGPILTDVTRVNRQQYLEERQQRWCARLPALITKSVNDVTYRQFDYGRQMNFKTALARWFHKQLSHNYVNASYQDLYTIKHSTVARDSCLLAHSRMSRNVETVKSALDELKGEGVVTFFNADVLRTGNTNKILDVKYEICPGMDFVADQKAANARRRDAIASLNPPGPATTEDGEISPFLMLPNHHKRAS